MSCSKYGRAQAQGDGAEGAAQDGGGAAQREGDAGAPAEHRGLEGPRCREYCTRNYFIWWCTEIVSFVWNRMKFFGLVVHRIVSFGQKRWKFFGLVLGLQVQKCVLLWLWGGASVNSSV